MAKKKHTKLWEWQQKAKQGGTCEKCKVQTSYLTVDHIVPVTYLDAFDLTGEAKYEDARNFQLLCRPCNAMKANRFDATNLRTTEIIYKYLR